MSWEDCGMARLLGANLSAGRAQDQQGGLWVNGLWVSEVVDQATELEKSVDSNLRETKSFPSITRDDLQTT